MVILIGGVGCIGKTLMAQKILEIYKIPYLSIDHLKMGICRGYPHCGFTPESKNEIIKGIVMTNIENDQNIIIEGCYLPKTIDDIGKEYLSKIIIFYMGFSEEYIRKNFIEKIIKKMNIIENRNNEFYETMEQYIIENKNNKTRCIENNINCFEINNDYEKEMENVYEWIKEEWNKKINIKWGHFA
jgi:putative acetyltransferase